MTPKPRTFGPVHFGVIFFCGRGHAGKVISSGHGAVRKAAGGKSLLPDRKNTDGFLQ